MMPVKFSADDILFFHAISAQDFPSSQTVDADKIRSFYQNCLEFYEKQGGKDPYLLAACIAYKLSKEKPFGDANNKTAVQSVMAILNDYSIEISAPYSALKSLIEDVEYGTLGIEGLVKELKAL